MTKSKTRKPGEMPRELVRALETTRKNENNHERDLKEFIRLTKIGYRSTEVFGFPVIVDPYQKGLKLI